MEREDWLAQGPFDAAQKEKDTFFDSAIRELGEWHRERCAPYARLCAGTGEASPLLPVSAFREQELMSIPEEDVVRVLTSSGTSGQIPSKIFIDERTAVDQQIALTRILSDFIGGSRLPMLILDTKDVFRDPAKYTARGAGIAGFAAFSKKRVFALDEHMNPDFEAIRAFAEEYSGKRVLLFGFTYMIRQYFILPLLASDFRPDLSGAVLLHGGGWKKMTDLAVSPEVFKNELKEAAGITHVHNYYGMAEQLGSIFVECECGRLHASRYSDIRTVHPEDFSPCGTGEQGVVELVSMLPTSYPGHRILTEDLGRILGEDDCPCGRKGRYFAIDGRVSKTVVRGCSDTFAAEETMRQMAGELTVHFGEFPPSGEPVRTFDERVTGFLEALSKKLRSDPVCRTDPDCLAFAFWVRRARVNEFRERYKEARRGKGHVLITAPSNMPALFAYNMAVALLAGCSCTIRLSGRQNATTELLRGAIASVVSDPEFSFIKERCAVISFPRSDSLMEQCSRDADARIFWGSDATVGKLSSIPAKEGCLDIPFPDRRSVSVLSADAVAGLSDDDLMVLCDRFYRDTYGADQNACSSPAVIFWTGNDTTQARGRFWSALACMAKERYRPEAALLLAKYDLIVKHLMNGTGLDMRRHAGNILVTADLPLTADERFEIPETRFGIFFERELSGPEGLPVDMGDALQTVTVFGYDPDEIAGALQRERTYDALRVVPVGSALEFDPVWDGKDLIRLLSAPCD